MTIVFVNAAFSFTNEIRRDGWVDIHAALWVLQQGSEVSCVVVNQLWSLCTLSQLVAASKLMYSVTQC